MSLLSNFFLNYTYLGGAMLYAIPFLILFLYKKDCRKGMLYVGTLAGLAAFLYSHISVSDYWNPNFIFEWFPLEDFLYGFFFGGFVSECADIFIKHKFKKNKNRKRYLLLFTLFIPLIIFVGMNILGFNSIIILLFFTVIISIASVFFNHRIIYLQLLSGFIGLVLTFVIFQILLYFNPEFTVTSWNLENISGIFYFGIPLEEYLFAFMGGFCITHLYEMVVGKDVKF
jgi:hypothetical protein